jgi:hypothetical protein
MRSRMIASAVGERQMLPEQTNNTLVRTFPPRRACLRPVA